MSEKLVRDLRYNSSVPLPKQRSRFVDVEMVECGFRPKKAKRILRCGLVVWMQRVQSVVVGKMEMASDQRQRSRVGHKSGSLRLSLQPVVVRGMSSEFRRVEELCFGVCSS